MFRFKQFAVRQDRCPMKVGTDGVLLGAWAEVRPGDRRMLDVGTGTGLIALMLAQRSAAWITAVDIQTDRNVLQVGIHAGQAACLRQILYIAGMDVWMQCLSRCSDTIRLKNSI